MLKRYLFLLLLISPLCGYSQSISGYISDVNGNNLPSVNISVINESIGTTSDPNGNYNLIVRENRSLILAFSFIGYQIEKIRIPMLKSGQHYKLDIKLKTSSNVLNDVIITDQRSRKESFNKIKTKHVSVLPGNSGGIEAILKTLPGVSSANELSSQYSVRGGNFDENLVYVNGIEIYRPFLVRSGRQEGLSFVNTDMVNSILFSAGGFDAKYGDKMSSVLDITYKNPIKNMASLQLSLLGGSSHFEGISNNTKLSYILGARYKTSKYLLNSLDTEAEYSPNFSDIQTYINYKINNSWDISFLGNINQNQYTMIPRNRDTEFGTVNEALKLSIYFEGQEVDSYETFFGALSTGFQPNKNLKLQFTTSAFKTFEEENFDIVGEYWLYQLENNLGSTDFGSVAFDRGVGKYINHARNSLNANVINLSHKGYYTNQNLNFDWGFKLQKEEIDDNINEWNLIDSAFYNYPHPDDNINNNADPNQQIILSQVLKTKINLRSYRNSGFMQVSKDLDNITIKAGTRASYWTFNEELLISPRASIAYAPIWKKDIVFRAASGIYYQSSFYKEVRTLSGTLNREVKSQKSIHYLFGVDYLFYSWGRPFKWITEIYYKDLENLIPYKVNNVRIQYLTDQISNGYATGIDMKINGEFVPGVESWASLSIMKTEEDIVNDFITNLDGSITEVGFIPRPTDQRVSFSMFFQDYIPNNPNYKMHLNLVYGTGLSFGPPNSEKHEDILKIPDYRRVDIGFSVLLKGENKRSRINWLNIFESIWVSAEVFNLLDINNTVSYLWVTDITGREYAVPNYLTSRQLNTKLILTF